MMRRSLAILLVVTLIAAFLPYWSPARAQNQHTIWADNTGGNKSLQIVRWDDSNWPDVKVTFKNISPWWLHLYRNPNLNLGNVGLIDRNDTWAVSEYVPSGHETTYTFRFNETSSSSIGIFGTA